MSLAEQNFLNQKAQELSFALIKISVYIRRSYLRQKIEQLAFELLETTSSQDMESAFITAGVLEGFIKLGKTIYEIEPINSRLLLQEIDGLRSAIKEQIGILAGDEGAGLEDVFSKLPAISENLVKREPIEAYSDNTREADPEQESGNQGTSAINATIRQSAIIEKIRQSGNQAQLKDILAEFPDVSERTIRYDLQRLCSQGVLERVGNGGPGSYYALRQLRQPSN